MKTYNVVKRSDGSLIHSYSAENPVEWEGMEFTECDHLEVTLEPETVITPSQSVKITKLAFRNRFKPEEKVALELASKDDPSLTLDQRKPSAMIRVYLDDVNSASFIDLNRKDTRKGVFILEQFGLIAKGRALQILDTQPTEEEVFYG